ncbi:MAG TPA: PadR family transcriptional regulator [Clostridia bacterium]|nr:PadR family transcriptional regulator [Clostridia bacterium]
MSLETGILGFLSMKPLSGYDLKRLFNMSAAYFWPADQAQIYRTLKKLTADGLAEFEGHSPGMTVDRKVYKITDKGRETFLSLVSNPSESDFFSRLPNIMQLFFSGGLSTEEQLELLDRQLRISNELIQKLKDNYEKNVDLFAEIVGLPEGDRRLNSATYAHRWGILRGEAYAKLLEEIKEDILRKSNLR